MSRFEEMRDYGGIVGGLAEAEMLDDVLKLLRADCPQCGYRLNQNAAGEVDCPQGHYFKATRPTRGEGA